MTYAVIILSVWCILREVIGYAERRRMTDALIARSLGELRSGGNKTPPKMPESADKRAKEKMR